MQTTGGPAKIIVRFYGPLNDFLPRHLRQKEFTVEPNIRQSAKDLIEALGAPHTEVGKILINGDNAGFEAILSPGDRLTVYPVFASDDYAEENFLSPTGPLRFIADVHLGTLAKYLRMLGLDTDYTNDRDDEEIIRIANDEGRIILTRDTGLLKRNEAKRGYWLRSQSPGKQLREVTARYLSPGIIEPFSRCMECNGKLMPVPKEKVEARLLPRTRKNFDEFYQCTSCGRVYWKGSHWERMKGIVDEIEKMLRKSP